MKDLYIAFIKELVYKSLRILFGLFISALGTVLLINADLGLNPWNVLNQGISLNTSLTFGQAAQTVGLCIVLCCSFFKTVPGVGTLLNMFFIGFFVDILNQLSLFSVPQNMIYKLLMLACGIIAFALGTCFYIRENLGAGPRDTLMVVLCKRTRFKAGTIKVGIELIVIFIGYLLGGKVGVGSLIIALTVGPVLNKVFSIFNYDVKKNHQENIIETFNRFKSIANNI
ncbi:MAG: hypothetical protein GX201_04135 [Clostridiales bacterium]|nr:hypothetical protein [Clostridiales bacterium]